MSGSRCKSAVLCVAAPTAVLFAVLTFACLGGEDDYDCMDWDCWSGCKVSSPWCDLNSVGFEYDKPIAKIACCSFVPDYGTQASLAWVYEKTYNLACWFNTEDCPWRMNTYSTVDTNNFDRSDPVSEEFKQKHTKCVSY
jgi:hypothetical protein